MPVAARCYQLRQPTCPLEETMTKPPLLMTADLMEMKAEQLDAAFEVHRYHSAEDKAGMLADVGERIVAIASGGHAIAVDADLISKLPNLKMIGHFGVGYDMVDTAAAKARGIIVTNTPDVLTEEVADTALGLLIMTVRELSQAEQYLRAGRWDREGDYHLTPATLRDRSVGIVGLGRIGKAIAKRCEAFGLGISYFGRNRQGGVPYTYYADIVEMARAVDTLIVVTPGTAETRNLINADVLSALGSRGVLVNIARGSVVDEAALMAALRNRTIFAAGLDVMLNEPHINPELMEIDNLVLLPHVGSASLHTRQGMAQMVVDNLIAYKEGRTPLSPVPETPFSAWT
jgi:lactate dehydrogenase-like 2-hydroxyacid dehydrogenase